jgi:flavin-dependent dehydrogenase
LAEQLADFCDFLRQRGRIPADIPEKFHGHAYLLHGHSARRLIDEGVLLVGDAAGLAYPESGEGIRPAIESGLIAAAVVGQAAGDYSRQRLLPYGERLSARFGAGAEAGASAVPQGLRNILAGALLGSRWFTRRVVLDRWFLHAHLAALQ